MSRGHRSVNAKFDDEHRLVIHVHDMGPTVEEFFGKSDYEFWFTVDVTGLDPLARRLGVEVDQLLTEVQEKWLGENFYEFQEILRSPEIGAHFACY